MILRIKKTEINAILFACGLRDIETTVVEDLDSDELCYVIIEITSPEEAWYVSKDVCGRIRDEEDYAASENSLFNLFKVNVG